MSDRFQPLDDAALEMVNGGNDAVPCFPYVVKKGDALSVLAQRYHTTVAILVTINNLSNPNLIYEGRIIMIPYSSGN